MGRMDWVPGGLFGEALTVGTGTIGQFTLYADREDSAASEFDQYEDDNELFIHRIVGQMHYFSNIAENRALFEVLIVPGLMDVDGANSPQTIFGAGDVVAIGSGYDAEKANGRIWYHRKVATVDSLANFGGLDAINHPWWTFIDIKPRQKIGINESPILVIINTGANGVSIGCIHNLRMLMSRVGE